MIRYDSRMVAYDFGETDELAPAYAVSIHKSQGSECPVVVIPLAMQHGIHNVDRAANHQGHAKRCSCGEPVNPAFTPGLYVAIAVAGTRAGNISHRA